MQWNQPTIDILQAPRHHLRGLVEQMCTRNRTRMAEGLRYETEGLDEIDKYATTGKTKEMTKENRMRARVQVASLAMKYRAIKNAMITGSIDK